MMGDDCMLEWVNEVRAARLHYKFQLVGNYDALYAQVYNIKCSLSLSLPLSLSLSTYMTMVFKLMTNCRNCRVA